MFYQKYLAIKTNGTRPYVDCFMINTGLSAEKKTTTTMMI